MNKTSETYPVVLLYIPHMYNTLGGYYGLVVYELMCKFIIHILQVKFQMFMHFC